MSFDGYSFFIFSLVGGLSYPHGPFLTDPHPRRSAILLKSPKYIYTTNYCFIHRLTSIQHHVLFPIGHTTYCVINSTNPLACYQGLGIRAILDSFYPLSPRSPGTSALGLVLPGPSVSVPVLLAVPCSSHSGG